PRLDHRLEANPLAAFPGHALMVACELVHEERIATRFLGQDRRQGFRMLRDAVASGDFRPVIDRTYPLEEISEAYRYAETGTKIGNLVIDVDRADSVS
ncbi:MAG: zinc-binding dehydrogenase, partial [Acidimicrobiia bacterium]|nr:zinc-binding dehydrogenase [Acidimicrobiia bacterium]